MFKRCITFGGWSGGASPTRRAPPVPAAVTTVLYLDNIETTTVTLTNCYFENNGAHYVGYSTHEDRAQAASALETNAALPLPDRFRVGHSSLRGYALRNLLRDHRRK